jgi:hypothetical protein
MESFLFKLFKFIFLFFKKHYYKGDNEESYRHTLILFTAILIFPILAIPIGFQFNLKLCPSCDEFTNKLLMMPIFIFIVFLVSLYIRSKGFYKKLIELDDFDFSNYKRSEKIRMYVLILLLGFSIIWLSLLILFIRI